MRGPLVGARGSRRVRGFTLLETLVTLVIVALVAGLLSEGLFQLGRLEQRLGGEQLQAQVGRLHVVWVQQALEGLLPGAQNGAERLEGSSRLINGVSTLVPVAQAQGPRALRLELRYRQESGLTELLLSHGVAPEALGNPVALARWQGDRGQWLYQQSDGAWLSQWPPALDTKAPALPRAIALDRGEGEGLLLVAVPQAGAEPLGQRVDVEKLP